MGDIQSSFLSRFYNSDSSKGINFEDVRYKCEPGQKSFVSSLFDQLVKRYAERRNDEAKCNRQPRGGAPPKSQADLDDAKAETKKKDDAKDAKANEPPRALPPEDDSLPRCFIKEQNPLAPLCCEVKSDDEDDEPCPPAGYPQVPRAPSCGCDRCRKSGYHGRCCDRRTYAQQSAQLPPRLERA